MKNATECGRKLNALIKKLPETAPPEFPAADDPIAMLILSSLMAETSTERALTAYGRLLESIVDFNDLRVSMPHEVVGYIGSRYPRAQERCERLRRVLRHIYLREHCICLDRLREEGKRDGRKYIESLEGMTPYVSSCVMLLCFDAHAMPVDEQLRDRLVAAGAADEQADVTAVSTWLARQVKAGDGARVHHKLQAWIDRVGPVGSTKGRSRRASGSATARSSAGKGGGTKKRMSSTRSGSSART